MIQFENCAFWKEDALCMAYWPLDTSILHVNLDFEPKYKNIFCVITFEKIDIA